MLQTNTLGIVGSNVWLQKNTKIKIIKYSYQNSSVTVTKIFYMG
jgi:hypothetical protein